MLNRHVQLFAGYRKSQNHSFWLHMVLNEDDQRRRSFAQQLGACQPEEVALISIYNMMSVYCFCFPTEQATAFCCVVECNGVAATVHEGSHRTQWFIHLDCCVWPCQQNRAPAPSSSCLSVLPGPVPLALLTTAASPLGRSGFGSSCKAAS